MQVKDKYLNPFTDFGFKKLFGIEPNKDILIDFLTELLRPERRHFSRNPEWGPSDFGCTKLGDGHGLRRPAFVPARTPRGTRTPAMTGHRVAWPSLSSPPVLTRRTPTKRSALRLRGGRRLRSLAFLCSSP